MKTIENEILIINEELQPVQATLAGLKEQAENFKVESVEDLKNYQLVEIEKRKLENQKKEIYIFRVGKLNEVRFDINKISYEELASMPESSFQIMYDLALSAYDALLVKEANEKRENDLKLAELARIEQEKREQDVKDKAAKEKLEKETKNKKLLEFIQSNFQTLEAAQQELIRVYEIFKIEF